MCIYMYILVTPERTLATPEYTPAAPKFTRVYSGDTIVWGPKHPDPSILL